MKTVALIAIFLLAGWLLPGQDNRELSDKIEQLKKELNQTRVNSRSLKVQLKQLKNELASQQEKDGSLQAGLAQLQARTDSTEARLLSLGTESEAYRLEQRASLNKLTVIIVAGLAVLVLLMIVFMISHRRMHEERSQRLETLALELREKSASELLRLEEKLLARIALLEEKVF